MSLSHRTFHFPGPIVVGPGCLAELATHLAALGLRRPLVVTDPGIIAAGLLERAKAALKGQDYAVFSEVQPNPTDHQVRAGVAFYRAEGCDGLIALGGGSAIDAAKAIRVLATHPEPLEQYYFDAGGADRLTPNLPPLISIPTTAGTGSEVSRGAIITDTSQNRKRLVAGPGMMSSRSLLDPELTLDLPPFLTAITGMDALTHLVEGYVGTHDHPIAAGIARQGVRLCARFLPVAFADGHHLQARQEMLLASAMGALAFQKGLGVIHSLAHQLSTEAGLPHGLANAILLPFGMEFNLPVCVREYAELGWELREIKDGGGRREEGEWRTEEGWARAAIAAVRQLAADLGLPPTLSAAGVKRESLPRMVAPAFADHCHRTNPRPCTEEDLAQLLEAAF
jgi:4-hydroxybutyrate dehydrogenase